jgi:hypothetical protein
MIHIPLGFACPPWLTAWMLPVTAGVGWFGLAWLADASTMIRAFW